MKLESRKTCSLLSDTSSWHSKPKKWVKRTREQYKALPLFCTNPRGQPRSLFSCSPRLLVACFSIFAAVLLRWLALLFLAKYDSTASVSSGESPAEASLPAELSLFFLPFRLGCRKYATERDAEPEERWNPMSRRGFGSLCSLGPNSHCDKSKCLHVAYFGSAGISLSFTSLIASLSSF